MVTAKSNSAPNEAEKGLSAIRNSRHKKRICPLQYLKQTKTMGLFSRKKCPIHGIEYSVGKNYMCQLYYYCKKCSSEAKKAKDLEKRVADLEKKLSKH